MNKSLITRDCTRNRFIFQESLEVPVFNGTQYRSALFHIPWYTLALLPLT